MTHLLNELKEAACDRGAALLLRAAEEIEQLERGMGTQKTPRPQTIIDLARDNRDVQLWLTIWRQGHVTWEQALIGMVGDMCEANARMETDLSKRISESRMLGVTASDCRDTL